MVDPNLIRLFAVSHVESATMEQESFVARYQLAMRYELRLRVTFAARKVRPLIQEHIAAARPPVNQVTYGR